MKAIIKKFSKPVPMMLLSIVVLNVHAQTELTMYHLENVYQATYNDLTSIPQHKVSIGMPGHSSIFFSTANTGFSYGDLRIKQAGGDSLSPSKAIAAMRKNNYLYAGGSIDLFHLRFKARENFISFHVRSVLDVRHSYPKQFMTFLWDFNESMIGSDLDLKKLSFDAMAYNEYAIGWTREFEKFIVGTRLKYLQGLSAANLRTNNSKISFGDKSENYAWSSNADIVANYSLPWDSTELENESLNTGNIFGFKNSGFGVDLGFEYKVTPKLDVSLNVVNVGFIRWNSNPVNHNIAGGFDYRGLDIFGNLIRDGENYNFEDDQKKLEESFNYTKTSKSFTTWLTPQFLLTGRYRLDAKTQLSAGVNFERYKAFKTGAHIGAYHEFGRILNIGLTYSARYGRYDNIGLGVVLKPGPCQLYFASDNLFVPLARWAGSGFYVTEKMVSPVKLINFRFGMNYVFGRIRQADGATRPY